MEEKKRLTRSNNKMIGGVCAGLGLGSDDRTDRVGIDGFLRWIRRTVIRYLVVGNA